MSKSWVFFAGSADGVEARSYRDTRNNRKDFKRVIDGGISHISLEGHLEEEEEMREEGFMKKQKTKENKEARNTQSVLYTIAKNIARENRKEEQ